MDYTKIISDYGIVWGLFILIITYWLFKGFPAIFRHIEKIHDEHRKDLENQQKMFKDALDKIVNGFTPRLENIEAKLDNIIIWKTWEKK
jgi:tetrahydromethanopterin S-methyltransferase subunit G